MIALAGRTVSQSSLEVATNKMDSALHELGLDSDISQTVQAAVAEGEGTYAAPPMPVGVSESESWNATLGAHVTEADEATGLEYYPVVRGPYLLSVTELADARYVDNIPGFSGSGMTISFWYRHVSCFKDECPGLYILRAFDPFRWGSE